MTRNLLTISLAITTIAGSLSVIPSFLRTSPERLTNDPQTYWWCEMHHAPQNIPGLSVSTSIVDYFWPPETSTSILKSARRAVTAADLRTGVVEVDPRRNSTGRGEYGWGDNPPQTFWCEMHQKASNLHAEAQLSLSRAVADESVDVAGVGAVAGATAAELRDAARVYRAKAEQLELAAEAAAAEAARTPV